MAEKIIIGTSGYSFRDWKGVFYPENLRSDEFLSYYKDYFAAVEINTSYYGIPRPSVFENMVRQTPDDFQFIVKTNKATTHEKADHEVADEFLTSLVPLRDAGRLAGILAQFPWSFRNTGKNRTYLAELGERYAEMPLFIEFRHNSWNRGEVYDFLERVGMRFVSVDEPQIGDMMPPEARATGDTAYIRFHGRNAKNWWGKAGDRYDYDYDEDELKPWIKRVEELEKTVWKIYAFFNNCHQGHAVRNALMFRNLLQQKGLQ